VETERIEPVEVVEACSEVEMAVTHMLGMAARDSIQILMGLLFIGEVAGAAHTMNLLGAMVDSAEEAVDLVGQAVLLVLEVVLH
jgi:hypothetical protein